MPTTLAGCKTHRNLKTSQPCGCEVFTFLVSLLLSWGLVLTSAAVGAGHRACPNEGNHRGLPLQKMAGNRIKPQLSYCLESNCGGGDFFVIYKNLIPKISLIPDKKNVGRDDMAMTINRCLAVSVSVPITICPRGV